MKLSQQIKPEHIAQLKQLRAGPTWDGDLISKDARDFLFNKACVRRVEGWNFLAEEGVRLCLTFGILKS